MIHTRIRPFNTKETYPEQKLDNDLCQAVVALCSRILEDKRLNDRLLVSRIGDTEHEELVKFTGPRHFGRKIAAALVMAAVVFFSFATGVYRVGANATLEGSVRRVLVAPLDGYVASAPHPCCETHAARVVNHRPRDY